MADVLNIAVAMALTPRLRLGQGDAGQQKQLNKGTIVHLQHGLFGELEKQRQLLRRGNVTDPAGCPKNEISDIAIKTELLDSTVDQ